MVLYGAVSSPLDRSKRFTLSSPGRPVHSDTVLGFSWKHSSHAAIAQRLFTHISTTVYSQVLIYTAESTEASWRERKCPNFETVTTGIRTRALSIASLGFYQLSYRAPQRTTTRPARIKHDTPEAVPVPIKSTIHSLTWSKRAIHVLRHKQNNPIVRRQQTSI